jgi:hypothetical protein
MRRAQTKNAKPQQHHEVALPEIKTTQKHQVVFRNDWKDYIAQNEPATEVESVVLARTNETLSILAEDDGPIDQVYSIVFLSTDQMIDEGAEVDWVQT